MKQVILWILIFYRNIVSPILPARCRFYPSCSQYCHDAVVQYGVIKGFFLGMKRIFKCHPFNAGGYDPVK